MARALDEAALADHATTPNPMVGALVVRDGDVIATAHHEKAGGPHAEVLALEAAGAAARGADLFVTLEPCTVHGRTPPCVDAVIAAGPRRVVVAMIDPNPAVAGRGVAALRDAGIAVEVGAGGPAAEALNRFYLTHARLRRPFVTAKFAASLDGRTATRTGASRWISSEESRLLAHRLRARHDAVLVGAGTAVADDPALTVRIDGETRTPLRVVVDSTLRLEPGARMLIEPGGPVLLATLEGADASRRAALEDAGAEVLVIPGIDGRVDLAALLTALGRRQVTSVLAEGGAALLGSLRDARLIDSVVAFLAPALIGGAEAVPAMGGEGAASLDEALRLEDVEVARAGGDVVVTAYAVR